MKRTDDDETLTVDRYLIDDWWQSTDRCFNSEKKCSDQWKVTDISIPMHPFMSFQHSTHFRFKIWSLVGRYQTEIFKSSKPIAYSSHPVGLKLGRMILGLSSYNRYEQDSFKSKGIIFQNYFKIKKIFRGRHCTCSLVSPFQRSLPPGSSR